MSKKYFKLCKIQKHNKIPVWCLVRLDKALGYRPGGHAFESCTDIYVVHCWLINPNKLNLLSWLLAYLSD